MMANMMNLKILIAQLFLYPSGSHSGTSSPGHEAVQME